MKRTFRHRFGIDFTQVHSGNAHAYSRKGNYPLADECLRAACRYLLIEVMA